jgi:multisubunit Na+/H+ antiporter MnhB subunit
LLGGASVGLLRTLGVVLALAVVLVAVAFFERGRQRRDLAAIIAVGAGAVMLALLGFSLGALLVAIVGAALAGVAVVRYWTSPQTATAVAE